MQRTGIFAGLRRRRWALCLAFGYALFLNALLGTSVEGAAMAAADPLAGIAAASHCAPAGLGTPGRPSHSPADHQQTCPLCGPACPMTGFAPIQAAAPILTGPVGRAHGLALAWPATGTIAAQSLFDSDTDSQGPPAA
jgi:hypothetical protein